MVQVKSFHLRLYLSSGLWHLIQEPTVCLLLHAFLFRVSPSLSHTFEGGQYEACGRMGCGEEALTVLCIFWYLLLLKEVFLSVGNFVNFS